MTAEATRLLQTHETLEDVTEIGDGKAFVFDYYRCWLCSKITPQNRLRGSSNECVNCHEQMKYNVPQWATESNYSNGCYLCHCIIFTGDLVCDTDGSTRYVCEPCLRNYTREELQEELDDERIELEDQLTRFNPEDNYPEAYNVMPRRMARRNGSIGMCMECGELSEHSDLCSRNIGDESNE